MPSTPVEAPGPTAAAPDSTSNGTTGNARSLLLTVLGDLVLPSGGEAWLGALSETMAVVGVSAPATRQALRRLAGQGLVEPQRRGRLASYRLTPAGRRRLDEAAERIYLRRPLRWDRRWRLLTYSFPESQRASRDSLRRELEWLGYGAIAPGLWVCPWDLGARLDAVLAKHGVVGSVENFTSEHDGDDGALAGRAYALGRLTTAHAEFIARWADDLDAVTQGDLPDARGALAARIRLVHDWRKFLFLDPGLPPELLPDDWLGVRAADTFRRLYAAFEAPAWAAWDAHVATADPLDRPLAHPRSNLDPPDVSAGGPSGGSPDERLAEFRAHIDAGRKVEATDWMPDEYRALAIKFIEMHANSELMGALPEREWIARAPTLRRKRSLAAKVQDEVGHAHLIYRVAEDLGKPREQMFDDLIEGRTKFHNVFHYPTYSWGDVAVIGFLVDGAAIVTQRPLLDTSYAPYLRVMRRVVAEESLHQRHGEDITLELASGTPEQVEMLQEAVNRWWVATLHFFGPMTPRESDKLLSWGIKTRTNEESRQEYLSQYVPKLWDMGIEVPDPALRYDVEAKVWHYTEPDWDELYAIVKGQGEVTQQRLAWRRWMRESHEWLRPIVTGQLSKAA